MTAPAPERALPAAPLRTAPAALCPRDGAPLDGGPVAYLCPLCRRGVMAADARTGSAVAAPTHVLTARGTGGQRAELPADGRRRTG